MNKDGGAKLKRVHDRFFDDATHRLDEFGKVLLITLASLVLLLSINLYPDEGESYYNIWSALLSLSVGLTFLFSLTASGVRRHIRNIAAVLIWLALGLTFAVTVVEIARPNEAILGGAAGINPIWVFVALITPFAATRRLLMHVRVSLMTIAAAIAAYLQIAIAFALLYFYLDYNSPSELFGYAVSSTSYAYYSLVTFTTLGYGDMSVTSELGRSLSVFEAVIGQIYLVTLVAMIVGKYGNARQSKD